MVLPLFKSHYSIGKSILTLEKKGSSDPNGACSIVDICLEENIKDLYLVDDSMGGFMEAYVNSKDAGLNFRFGLRISICDTKEKSEDSLERTSKYIIFSNNKAGYERLIKIYTFAAKSGFYYEPRIDFESLKSFWNENDLTLVIPFYDSFLHLNSLRGSLCVPDFSFCAPRFIQEDNDIPFNFLINKHLKSFCQNKYEILKAKSIYYKNRDDFKAYLTFRCINKRTTLNKPNLEHMTSDEFSLESWKEQQA